MAFGQSELFTRKVNVNTKATVSDLKFGNINGDELPNDIVIAVQDEDYLIVKFDNSTALSGLRGNLILGLRNVPKQSDRRVELADLDNDGDIDVIYSVFSEQSSFGFFINNGTGSFSNDGNNYGNVTFVRSITSGYFNNDQQLDIAVLGNEELKIFFGNENLDFSESVSLPISNEVNTREINALDHDGDGIDEIYLQCNVGGGIDQVKYNGTDLSVVSISAKEGTEGFAFGDIDLDGNVDIVYSTKEFSSELNILFGDGSGNWEEQTLTLDFDPVGRDILIDDVDKDGDHDIAFAVTNSETMFHIMLN